MLCIGADGNPLADELVTVVIANWGNAAAGAVHWSQIGGCKTNAQGQLELQLAAGEYGVQRGEYRPWEAGAVIVPLTWTSTGAAVERVQF